jgi:hypothetical protein
MGFICYYGSIAAAIYLYIKTISIVKKIKHNEETDLDTFIGSILLGFIMFSIYYCCMG